MDRNYDCSVIILLTERGGIQRKKKKKMYSVGCNSDNCN